MFGPLVYVSQHVVSVGVSLVLRTSRGLIVVGVSRFGSTADRTGPTGVNKNLTG